MILGRDGFLSSDFRLLKGKACVSNVESGGSLTETIRVGIVLVRRNFLGKDW